MSSNYWVGATLRIRETDWGSTLRTVAAARLSRSSSASAGTGSARRTCQPAPRSGPSPWHQQHFLHDVAQLQRRRLEPHLPRPSTRPTTRASGTSSISRQTERTPAAAASQAPHRSTLGTTTGGKGKATTTTPWPSSPVTSSAQLMSTSSGSILPSVPTRPCRCPARCRRVQAVEQSRGLSWFSSPPASTPQRRLGRRAAKGGGAACRSPVSSPSGTIQLRRSPSCLVQSFSHRVGAAPAALQVRVQPFWWRHCSCRRSLSPTPPSCRGC